MATAIPKGTRLVAEVDLGGIGVAAGDEFDVDECNEHIAFDVLLATGAVTRAKATKPADATKPPTGGAVTKASDTTKPDAVKPSTGGEDGR